MPGQLGQQVEHGPEAVDVRLVPEFLDHLGQARHAGMLINCPMESPVQPAELEQLVGLHGGAHFVQQPFQLGKAGRCDARDGLAGRQDFQVSADDQHLLQLGLAQAENLRRAVVAGLGQKPFGGQA